MSKVSSDRLRRYPAMGFLLVAALLASLLPSALRLPLSGPTTAAELAPVPGQSDAPGDLSALGASSTGGLGSGSGILGSDADGGPAGNEPDTSLPNDRKNPGNKKCVEGRQTEDPLSPTCVPFFKGDNGGATAPGVTKDQIRVVIFTCSGNGLKLIDFSDESTWEGVDYGVVAAYVRYFNERYQIYDRKVRVFQTAATESGCNTAEENTAQVRNVHETLTPFFALSPFQKMHVEAARLGIMTEVPPLLRRDYTPYAPYVVSAEHDFDSEAVNAAAAVCARLAGGTARFAGDPTMHDKRRKFGILFTRGNDPTNVGARMMHEGINRTCPEKAGEVVAGYGSDTDPNTVVTQLRLAEVTTVIALTSFPYFAQADAQKWYPEWVRLGDHVGHNANTISGMPGASLRTGVMGLMPVRRWGLPQTQPHRAALAEGGCEGTCVPNLDRYDEFNLVFTGIQAAGPRLSPATWDRGIRSLPARQSRDPFAPSAYFSPGNHSFMKDYAFAWFDVGGVPPGGSRPGCWRLPQDGLRYRLEDWPSHPGDADIHVAGQPCQGDA